jgi:hypothetical protein
MMKTRQKNIPLRSRVTGQWFVDPELRQRLIDDAERLGTNLTTVVLTILGDEYKVKVEPNGRRSSPDRDQDAIHMMLPVRLIDAISRSANRRGVATFQDEVRHALSKHYGLPVPTIPRGRPAA